MWDILQGDVAHGPYEKQDYILIRKALLDDL